MKGNAENKPRNARSIMPKIMLVLGVVFVALILVSQGLKNKNFNDFYAKFNAKSQTTGAETTTGPNLADLNASPGSVEQQHTNLEKSTTAPISILQDPMVTNIITIAFTIFAFMKWIDVIAGIATEKNPMSRIVPAAMFTFFAFKWVDILNYLGIFNNF